MARERFKAAASQFRKTLEIWDEFHPAANNLSVCLFVQGKLAEAIDVQVRGNKTALVDNPFGLANLATLLYCTGEEVRARRHLDQACAMAAPSEDSCVKVCEALSRFRRHQEILDYIDRNRFDDAPLVRFYSGVAAANLGLGDRAEQDLRAVGRSHQKAELAACYLDDLRNGRAPRTVMGDWPYLTRAEQCPAAILDEIAGPRAKEWFKRRFAVDLCESLLNLDPSDFEDVLGMVRLVKHPAAEELLWKIAEGTYGPDRLRLAALQVLQSFGRIKRNVPFRMFIDGNHQDVKLQGVAMNEDFQFCDPPPPEWNGVYERALAAGSRRRPNWRAIGEDYLKISQAVPAFVPARFNYAVALVNQGLADKAEPVLRQILTEHPDYLFAAAALVSLLCIQNRIDEVGEIVTGVELPAETHPSAYVAWLMAEGGYFRAIGKDAEADDLVRQAHDIDPKHPGVRRAWKNMGR